MAAVLHDTIENTERTSSELDELSDKRCGTWSMRSDKTLDSRSEQLQIEHAPHLSRRAKAIELADKICRKANRGYSLQCRARSWFDFGPMHLRG